MERIKFERFIAELDLSVRSYNCIMRAYGSIYGLNCPEADKENVKGALFDVENYAELYNFLEKYGKCIRNLGKRSLEECFIAINKKIEDGDIVPHHRGKYIAISDKLPPLGVPLMVKTKNSMEGGSVSVKYPVYYAKEPYDNRYAWYFFSVDGMSKLLPEYSEVIEWKEIHTEE